MFETHHSHPRFTGLPRLFKYLGGLENDSCLSAIRKKQGALFSLRYEASQFGSPYIETEHLLLGILREDKALTSQFLRSHAAVESIRNQIEEHSAIRQKTSTSVDLPLSNECRRILAMLPRRLNTFRTSS